MSAAALIDELHARGAELTADGDRLLCRAPAGAITPELKEQIAREKAALLDALHGGVDPAPADQRVAYLLRTKDIGDLWLVPDEDAASELHRVFEAKGSELPILTFDEVPLLKGKSRRILAAALTAKAALPGARILQ